MHILLIEGMTCEACKRAISNAISNAVPGMTFEIDLRRKQVRYRNATAEQQVAVRNAIRDAGYGILESGRG